MKLRQETVRRILEWASSYPHIEVTGFVKLLVNQDEVVVPMENISTTPATDFAWSTDEMVAQWNRMDWEGSDPIALYHSHPGGKPDPSETDMLAALMVDMVYLIAFPEMNTIFDGVGNTIREDKTWRLSAWKCLERGVLVSEPLEIVQ